MNAIAIHSPEAKFASCLRRSLLLAAAALLSASLAGQAAWAQGDPSLASGDALARYQARHAHAVTIEQELKQRVAALEQQDAAASARSAQLQLQLGELMKSRQRNDTEIGRLQAEIAAKEQLLNEARTHANQVHQELQAVQQRIKDNEGNMWACYVPFVQIWCWADLLPKRDALDNQWRSVVGRLQALERERNEAHAALNRFQGERRVVDMQQQRLQPEIDAGVQRLKVLHAELASSRAAHQRHRTSLDSFSAELKQIETLPPSERAGVIERRLTRLDAQLASEMGQACDLFNGGGAPLPEPVRRACALG